MHPLAAAYGDHKLWLVPVSIRELRGVRARRGLVDLAKRVAARNERARGDDGKLIDWAPWIQDRFIPPAAYSPPWGNAGSELLGRVLDSLARKMMCEGASKDMEKGLHVAGYSFLEGAGADDCFAVDVV